MARPIEPFGAAPAPLNDLSLPEASVLGDALLHGVVKVAVWELPNRPTVGAERLQAAARLSEAGLLFLAGKQRPQGALRVCEEYLPTPRTRWTVASPPGF